MDAILGNTTEPPILHCEKLDKTYRSGGRALTIFADLDFEIREGERVAIVGESGSGKSTLLHLLGGLDRPTGGRILYKSRDVSTMPGAALADYRNREIGFVWQIHYLLPEFTALENVMMPLLIRGDRRSEAQTRARQHHALLLASGKLPGNLDARTGERIMDLIGILHGNHRLTSILVTHNPAFAGRCDRVLRMESGTLTELH